MSTVAEARFFDSRERYRMFVSTTTEKWEVAQRIGQELVQIEPGPSALRVFDAGLGDGRVLANVMRQMHNRFRHVPWLVVGKEISLEDVRATLARMADRFFEHPELVLVVTNMLYREAPGLRASTPEKHAATRWREVALEGDTAYEFASQIRDMDENLAADWQVRTSSKSGNPVYEQPAVTIIYRKDREFLLRPLVPKQDSFAAGYDLVIASQPYRSRTPADFKVRTVVSPLARALAPGGRMIAIQSSGRDPGMEIVEAVWPGEEPFPVNRHAIAAEVRTQLSSGADADLVVESVPDAQALFNYSLHTMGSEVGDSIGTSVILAAWNAAVYVAQMDDSRVEEAMQRVNFAAIVQEILHRHEGLWFNDECYIISRRKP